MSNLDKRLLSSWALADIREHHRVTTNGSTSYLEVLLAHCDALAERLASSSEKNYLNHAGERVTYQEATREALAYELQRHSSVVAGIFTSVEVPNNE